MWESHLIKSKYSRSLKLECGWTTFVPNKRSTSFKCVQGTDLASSLGTVVCPAVPVHDFHAHCFRKTFPSCAFGLDQLAQKVQVRRQRACARTHAHTREYTTAATLPSPPSASSCSSAYSSSRLMN